MRLAELLSLGSGYASSPLLYKRDKRADIFWTRENLFSPQAVLIVAVVALCTLGLVMIFSASSIELVEAGGSPFGALVSQAMAMLIAYALFFALTRTRGDFWTTDIAIWGAWAVTVAMLLVVLVAGTESHGATRWVYLGPMSIQPSEFAKITVVLVGARLFAEWEDGNIGFWRFVLLGLLFAALPLVLILLQKDLGTVIIIGSTLLFMAIMVGVRPAVVVVLLIVAGAIVLALILTSGYRRQRLQVWLNPGSDYYGDGWQLSHSLFAFGSGGFFGVGLGNSPQKYSYLPESQNDFIFAIIGEELGFLGAIVTIALFALIGWAGFRISAGASGRSGASCYVAAGITCCIMVQALLNMCGSLQILPLTGRPLPFVSAGGSSILSCMIMVGLLFIIARDNVDWVASPQYERSMRRSRLTVIEGGAPAAPARSSNGGR